MAEDLSYSFLLYFLLPSLFCLLLPTSVYLSNFSEWTSWCWHPLLFLLVEYLSSSCHGSWLERSRAALQLQSLCTKKLKAKNAIQAFLSTLGDDTHISANVLLSCLASFSSFFFIVWIQTPHLSPSTYAYPLYSICMSVPLRKKQPLAVNWPISHISFPKVKAGRE